MSHKPFEYRVFTGDESFSAAGQPVGLSVRDFWSFQFSNVWDMQEEIAEFIVAKALGQDLAYNKNGWTLWDITYKGKRIEVKETGYYHSWRTDGKVSKVRTFGIDRAFTVYKNRKSEFKRQNDVYVFCLNTGETQEESNPLVLDNWRFWVVPTSTINHLCTGQKKITLGRVRRITSKENGIGYADLKPAIDVALGF